MAQIDHEGGNQSDLIESFSLSNHFLIFEKNTTTLLDLFTLNNHVNT